MAKKKRARRKATPTEKKRLKAMRKKHGLGEFGPKAKSRSSTKRKTTRRSAKPMAKRKTYRRKSNGQSAMINRAVKGLGYSSIAGVIVGENPLYRAVAGYMGGKKEGAAAAFGLAYLKNNNIGLGNLSAKIATVANGSYSSGGY